jgi:hypothetical protein
VATASAGPVEIGFSPSPGGGTQVGHLVGQAGDLLTLVKAELQMIFILKSALGI